MCGRFTLTADPAAVAGRFELPLAEAVAMPNVPRYTEPAPGSRSSESKLPLS
jgi:hypothetical protein